MKIIAAIGLAWALLVFPIFGKDPKPKRQLTEAEMQMAYNVSVNYLMTVLKAPATATFEPISQARFSAGIRNSIDVRFYVDSQNSFAAMLRTKFKCRVWPKQRKDGLYNVTCLEDNGLLAPRHPLQAR